MLNKIFRIIVSIPLLPLYALITWIRNCLFDKGIFKSTSFSIPVISIGNLNTGGTGKTPHIEYFVRMLQDAGYEVGIVSRGYGRKTYRPILANSEHKAQDIGDEPRQYIHKFPNIGVMVDARRVRGIQLLLTFRPQTQIILLDDAFQHRYVKPSFSVLLTNYSKPYCSDQLLPLGNLRECRSGAKRANSIIVSKCPESLNTEDQIKMIHNIKPLHTQSLFFSKIHYGKVIWQTLGLNNLELNANEVKADQTCVLFAGIAHPEPLCSYLQSLYKKVIPRYYEDHHVYTSAELLQFVKEASKYKNSVVICTEKDFMRLDNWDILKEYTSIPFGYLPIEVQVTDPKFSDYLLQKIAI